MNETESIFQDEKYYLLMGKEAGKKARQFPETKYQALQMGKAEFDRRKLLKHEKAFITGYVSSLRDGFFTGNEPIGVI